MVGIKGNQRSFPHPVMVRLDDELNVYVEAMSRVLGVPKAEMVRLALVALRDTPHRDIPHGAVQRLRRMKGKAR